MTKKSKSVRASKTKKVASRKPFGWVDQNEDRRLAANQDMARYFPRPDPPPARDPNGGIPQSKRDSMFDGLSRFSAGVKFRG